MRRRSAVLAVLTLMLGTMLPALAAAGPAPFSVQAFAEAQDAGKGIVVFVHAPW